MTGNCCARWWDLLPGGDLERYLGEAMMDLPGLGMLRS